MACMKFILLLFLMQGMARAQTKVLNNEEILKIWTASEHTSEKKTTEFSFHGPLNARIKMITDSLTVSGSKTIIVYTIAYP
jgi:hypothetical protein